METSKYQEYLDVLNGSAYFAVVDPETAAAIECAQLPDRKELTQIAPGQVANKLK